ncbi:MAG: hypothetical protein AB1714_29200 [Acidobacteriota bacterium]
MKRGLTGIGCFLLIASVVAGHAAEQYYVPLIREQADNTIDLYWMKLNQEGKLVKGPRLIRDSSGEIWSAAIVPQGNKMLFEERALFGTSSQVYSVDVNPSSGKVTSGPVALMTGSAYNYYGLSISQDGRKFIFSRAAAFARFATWDIFLRKFKKNGSLTPNTIPIATSAGSESFPFITENARRAYYNRVYPLETGGPTSAIFMQALNANGTASGAPVLAMRIENQNLYLPMLNSAGSWMSYYNSTDDNLYVTRMSGAGLATGTPVKVTSVGAGQSALGGITRNAQILLYTLVGVGARMDGIGQTYTVYSQKLDSNGNPDGAPTQIVAAWPYWQEPWILAD